jgi:hypothetical protein
MKSQKKSYNTPLLAAGPFISIFPAFLAIKLPSLAVLWDAGS